MAEYDRDNVKEDRKAHVASDKAATAARDYVAALPADQFPNLVAVSPHFGQTDNDQSFELLIGLFADVSFIVAVPT